MCSWFAPRDSFGTPFPDGTPAGARTVSRSPAFLVFVVDSPLRTVAHGYDAAGLLGAHDVACCRSVSFSVRFSHGDQQQRFASAQGAEKPAAQAARGPFRPPLDPR